MTHDNTIKGEAFEQWVVDVLKPYVPDVKKTKTQERFDIHFMHEGVFHLIECKLFSMIDNESFGQFAFKKKQFRRLKYMIYPLLEEKRLFYIGGILMNPYEVYPIILTPTRIKELAGPSNGVSYYHVTMTKALKEEPLRNWIAEKFEINPKEIHYPEFRRYYDQ